MQVYFCSVLALVVLMGCNSHLSITNKDQADVVQKPQVENQAADMGDTNKIHPRWALVAGGSLFSAISLLTYVIQNKEYIQLLGSNHGKMLTNSPKPGLLNGVKHFLVNWKHRKSLYKMHQYEPRMFSGEWSLSHPELLHHSQCYVDLVARWERVKFPKHGPYRLAWGKHTVDFRLEATLDKAVLEPDLLFPLVWEVIQWQELGVTREDSQSLKNQVVACLSNGFEYGWLHQCMPWAVAWFQENPDRLIRKKFSTSGYFVAGRSDQWSNYYVNLKGKQEGNPIEFYPISIVELANQPLREDGSEPAGRPHAQVILFVLFALQQMGYGFVDTDEDSESVEIIQ